MVPRCSAAFSKGIWRRYSNGPPATTTGQLCTAPSSTLLFPTDVRVFRHPPRDSGGPAGARQAGRLAASGALRLRSAAVHGAPWRSRGRLRVVSGDRKSVVQGKRGGWSRDKPNEEHM